MPNLVGTSDLSLGKNKYLIESLYLHFPYCLELCNYCDFYKQKSVNIALESADFHHRLNREMELMLLLLNTHHYKVHELKTLYLGGGTPSLWGEFGAKFILEFLSNYGMKLSQEDLEFTLEVNPKTGLMNTLEAWLKAGANRFSVGIQTLNEELLPHLNRAHTVVEARETLSLLSKLKVNFSVDLMLGLPYSNELASPRNLIKEIDQLLAYGPSHFSIYLLTVKNNYQHFLKLPEEDLVVQEYLLVADYLKKCGFNQYEVSNWSLPNKESRHNLQYWKNNSVLSLGPSATGYLQEIGLRYKWQSQKIAYSEEYLSASDQYLEEIYLKLRTNMGVPANLSGCEKIIHKWAYDLKRGEIVEGIFRLNSQGFLLLDSLMDEFFKESVFE